MHSSGWRALVRRVVLPIIAVVLFALGLAACSGAGTEPAPPPGHVPNSGAPPPETSPEAGEAPPNRGQAPSDPGQAQTGSSPESGPQPPTTETAPPASDRPAQVTSVVDGDTVEVLRSDGTSRTVRVLGIDSPETTECWGPDSSEFARRTLAGASVRLAADPTQQDTDTYGRSLRYVLVDGSSYSILAAEAGAARSYVYDAPVQQHSAIAAAERSAQATGTGLWGPPCNGSTQTRESSPTPLSPEPPPEPAVPDVPSPEPVAPTPETPEPSVPTGDCAEGYSPCLPPPPPDLDCDQVDGPITVTGSDPHGLDGDDDGTACE